MYIKSASAKNKNTRLNMNTGGGTIKKFVYLKSGSAKKKNKTKYEYGRGNNILKIGFREKKNKTKYEYEASRLNMNTKKSLCT